MIQRFNHSLSIEILRRQFQLDVDGPDFLLIMNMVSAWRKSQ